MKGIEPSVFVRTVGGIISGTSLALLVGWGVASVYLTMSKDKIKKALQKSKQKTK